MIHFDTNYQNSSIFVEHLINKIMKSIITKFILRTALAIRFNKWKKEPENFQLQIQKFFLSECIVLLDLYKLQSFSKLKSMFLDIYPIMKEYDSWLDFRIVREYELKSFHKDLKQFQELEIINYFSKKISLIDEKIFTNNLIKELNKSVKK